MSNKPEPPILWAMWGQQSGRYATYGDEVTACVRTYTTEQKSMAEPRRQRENLVWVRLTPEIVQGDSKP